MVSKTVNTLQRLRILKYYCSIDCVRKSFSLLTTAQQLHQYLVEHVDLS